MLSGKKDLSGYTGRSVPAAPCPARPRRGEAVQTQLAHCTSRTEGPEHAEHVAHDCQAQSAREQQLRLEVRQLHEAMDHRAAIDQARGMIMAFQRCSGEEAWQVLVEVSQRTNTKLRDVALSLVATSTGDSLPADVRRQLSSALRHMGNNGK